MGINRIDVTQGTNGDGRDYPWRSVSALNTSSAWNEERTTEGIGVRSYRAPVLSVSSMPTTTHMTTMTRYVQNVAQYIMGSLLRRYIRTWDPHPRAMIS
jgi:hypothetical protein